MRSAPSCPRCGRAVREPGLWSSSWRCGQHGAVPPLQPVVRPTAESLEHTVRTARVPVWLPWPLPQGWVVTGHTSAGDERSGGVATVIACSGPAPLGGGAAELLLVAEEPGVGLGAYLSGLPGPDPGQGLGDGPPHAKVVAANHPAPLWAIAAPEAAVYAGEAKGCWVWAVLWPPNAGVLLLENLILRDLRADPVLPDLPYGALCPRLSGAASA